MILFSYLVWAQSKDCAFFMQINKFLSLVYLHLSRFNKKYFKKVLVYRKGLYIYIIKQTNKKNNMKNSTKTSKMETYKKGDKYGTSEVIKVFKTGAFIVQVKGGWKSLIIPNPYDGFWVIRTSRELSDLTKFHNGHINKNNWK